MSYKYYFPNGEYYTNPLSSSAAFPYHFSDYLGNSSNRRNELFISTNSRNNNFYRKLNNNLVFPEKIYNKRLNSLSPRYNSKNETPSSEMLSLRLKFNSVNEKIERLDNLLKASDFSRNSNEFEKRPNSYSKILKSSNNTFSNYINNSNNRLYSEKKNYSNYLYSPTSLSSYDKKINYSNYLSPTIPRLSDNNNDNLINSTTTKASFDYNHTPNINFNSPQSISIKNYSNLYDISNESNNTNYNIKSFNFSFNNFKEDLKNKISKQEDFNISPIKDDVKTSFNVLYNARKLINDYKSRNNKFDKKPNINLNINYNEKREIKNNKIFSDSDLNEIISNLHEKRKLLVEGGEDGLKKYKKLRLNEKMNKFNKRFMTGNNLNINTFEGNYCSNCLNNNSKKNKIGISIYSNPVYRKNEIFRYEDLNELENLIGNKNKPVVVKDQNLIEKKNEEILNSDNKNDINREKTNINDNIKSNEEKRENIENENLDVQSENIIQEGNINSKCENNVENIEMKNDSEIPKDNNKEEINNDENKNDEMKNKEIKKDDIKNDNINDDIITDDIKTEEVKQDDKNDNIITNDIKTEEVTEESKKEESKNEEIKTEENKTEEVKTEEIKNEEIKNEEIKEEKPELKNENKTIENLEIKEENIINEENNKNGKIKEEEILTGVIKNEEKKENEKEDKKIEETIEIKKEENTENQNTPILTEEKEVEEIFKEIKTEETPEKRIENEN